MYALPTVATRRKARRISAQITREQTAISKPGILAQVEAKIAAQVRQPTKYSGPDNLERLAAAEHITVEQARAGEALYRDWFHSGAAPSVTMNYGAVMVDHRFAGSPSQRIEARERFENAYQELPESLRSLIYHVCVHPRCGPYTWATATDTSRRKTLTDLRDGLQVLAQHYGFA